MSRLDAIVKKMAIEVLQHDVVVTINAESLASPHIQRKNMHADLGYEVPVQILSKRSSTGL